MIVSTSTKLKELREELHLSQEALARDAGITLATYRNAERGNRVFYSTAKKILDALNKERQARQKSSVTIDDLGLDLA